MTDEVQLSRIIDHLPSRRSLHVSVGALHLPLYWYYWAHFHPERIQVQRFPTTGGLLRFTKDFFQRSRVNFITAMQDHEILEIQQLQIQTRDIGKS